MHDLAHSPARLVAHCMRRGRATATTTAEKVARDLVALLVAHRHLGARAAEAAVLVHGRNLLPVRRHDIDLRAAATAHPVALHRQHLLALHWVALIDMVGRPPTHPAAEAVEAVGFLAYEEPRPIRNGLQLEALQARRGGEADGKGGPHLETTRNVAGPQLLGRVQEELTTGQLPCHVRSLSARPDEVVQHAVASVLVQHLGGLASHATQQSWKILHHHPAHCHRS
mmetsp:Transcript_91110/g.253689  ORF Transcript_91110/g.253689 Transcript_91110/m.253689 type:complete len:226 (+) Transcript_91110:305-982(+)